MVNLSEISQSLSIKKILLIKKFKSLNIFSSDDKYDINIFTEELFNEFNSPITYEIFNKMLNGILLDRERLKEDFRLKQEKIANLSTLLTNKLESIWFPTKKTKFVLHVGPTNSGKTYECVEAIKRSNGNCAYLSPLRLLAYEIFDKLNSIDINTSLITGEDKILVENAKVVSSTIEMLDTRKKYDVVVVDECFMITDLSRGKSWLKTILEADSNEIHLISNLETKDVLIDLLTRLNRNYEVKEYFRKVPLTVSDYEFQLNKLKVNKHKNKILFIVFSRMSVLYNKHVIESISNKNCSILYGNLPPEVKKEQMRRFVDGETDFCVSTDVVGMGLNLPCDIVCFLEITKFDGIQKRILNKTEMSQIGGRAGRFGLSERGIITSTDNNDLRNIDKILKSGNIPNNKLYFGLTYEIFNLLEGNYNTRIHNFKSLKIIPNKFDDLIKLQDTTEYVKLLQCDYVNKIEDDKKVWILINLPVKENNNSYFLLIAKSVYNNNKIPLINLKKDELKSDKELEDCEQQLSKLDLYMSMSNHSEMEELLDLEYLVDVVKQKENLVLNINDYLLDKKKMNKKFCSSCGKNVGIEWKHKNCDDCFKNKDKNDYYDF